MSVVTPPLVVVEAPRPPVAAVWLSRRALLGWWALSAVALLLFIGAPPVQRTQEGRVLETAREMLGAPARQWLIPLLNGELRLRKPPLTYWLAAAAFKAGGVGETAGRVPTAAVGWLALGVTFGIGRRLFGRRAGFFASAGLLTSYLFFRHTRLAETDAPAMLAVTFAVYAVLRAAGWGDGTEEQRDAAGPFPASARPPSALWLHAAAAGAGLAFAAKGGPGFFPIVFLVAFAAVTRRRDVLRRFVTSGAVLTLLALGASWYVYAVHASGWRQFLEEMHDLSSGDDHGSPFYLYFPQILKGSAPWSGLVVVGLIEAVRRCWADARLGRLALRGADDDLLETVRHRRTAHAPLRVVLAWVAATFVPLLFVGNKQFHYLTPLMPALFVLVGWVMDAAVGDGGGSTVDGKWAARAWSTILATVAAVGVAVVLIPWIARHELHRFRAADFALAGTLLAGMAATAWAWRARGRAVGLLTFLVACAVALPFLIGVWLTSLRPQNNRVIAAEIRQQLPQGPYCFFGENFSIPLCFNLRSTIPRMTTREKLYETAAAHPGLGVIAQTKAGRNAPKLGTDRPDAAARFEYLGRVTGDEQAFDLYRAGRGNVGSRE